MSKGMDICNTGLIKDLQDIKNLVYPVILSNGLFNM